MAHANPVGVVAAAFLFLMEKDAGFIGALKTRCSTLPSLTVARIGGVINFMVGQGLIDYGATADQVQGFYPDCRATGQGKSVTEALDRINLQANLNAAMTCVVGIQNDLVMLGVDKIIGAASSTLKATYGAYKTANTVYDYGSKGKDVKEKLVQLRDFIRAQRGASTDIFINAM